MPRRTKILCTLGPATHGEEALAALLAAGMDAVRLNFSHGSQKDHEETFARVRRVAAAAQRAIPIVQDIQGPKIRVGILPPEGVTLRDGAEVTLRVGEEVPEGSGEIPVSYDYLAVDVRPGDRILLDDGYLELRALAVEGREVVRAQVVTGGVLKRHKGVNFPGVRLSVKFPTEKDKQDLRFGQELGVDYVAASFVRSAADVARVRAEIDDANGTRVIAKIELREAVDNLDEIVRASDGVMVARGDLGVELAPEEVPGVQKQIIDRCDRLGVPVITATQMLESMILNPRPTRAEATDVYNAILDGTGAVMLSGETAVGKHPVEAVEIMSRIAEKAEERLLFDAALESRRRAVTNARSIPDAVAHAACRAAEELEAKAVLVLTNTGATARFVSKYRPRPRILVATPDEVTLRQLGLLWGAEPMLCPRAEREEEILGAVEARLLATPGFSKGDVVVLTSGKFGVAGTTNQMRVARLGDFGGAPRGKAPARPGRDELDLSGI